ncbi:MAG: M20/M25/M40 family metallo-hydrolase, partial [bacterium]
RDAQAKDYYIVWAPDWVKVAPADFARLGTAVRLSEYEILVGLERGLGPGDLRAVEHRIELIELEPVTPVDWRYDGEEPPTKKDPRIEAAINTISAAEYAGYIKQLQDFKTRSTGTPGCDAARDYIRGFFLSQNLSASLFPFRFGRLDTFYYPEKGYIIVDLNDTVPQRSRDYGVTWQEVPVRGVDRVARSYWLDGDIGFVTGYDGNLAKTFNGGATWEVLRFGTSAEEEYRTSCLYFPSTDVGWVGGNVNRDNKFVRTFLKETEDGGRTWTGQKPTEGLYPRAMSFYDPRRGWVSGPGGVFYTGDGGTTWRQTSLPWAASDLAATGPKAAWAALGYIGLWHTTDGVKWAEVNTGFEGDIDIVEFPAARRGYAAGDNLLKTSDGGRTWRKIRNAPPLPLTSLAFADEENGAVESSHRIYRTDDGGASFVDITDNIDFEAENVIGERRGGEAADEIVIIGGHFDSNARGCRLYEAPGADDNASGTACAMAAARAFRNMSFKRTVRYIAFGAEESGLIGSRAYAEHCAQKGEKIIAVLNADMVCYDEERGVRDDYVIAYDRYDWLFDYVKTVGGFYGQDLIYEAGTSGSDQYSFWWVGYAAIGAIEGSLGPGGHQSYPFYHTTEDTLDKLHPALGVRFVRDYAAMLAHLAGVGDYLFEPEPPGKAVTPFSRPFAVYPNPYSF